MNFADLLKKALEEQIAEKERKIPDVKPIYDMFESLVDVGFTEEQAMQILLGMISVAMGERDK